MASSSDRGGRSGATLGSGAILGIDIGGTKTALLAVSAASGARLAAATLPTPSDLHVGAFLAHLRREALGMLAGAGAAAEPVRAVGCAVPGQVDERGTVIGAGNLGWKDVPLRGLVEREWSAPAFVEQDANAGALGERSRGAAQTFADFVFLALGTGVGAGIIVGGRVHRGAHHAAGEVGNLVLERRALGRASHGLASRIGSRALRARARRATGRDVPPAVALSGASRDPKLAAIARDVSRDVAVAVVAIASVLDPEAIVFGGGTAARADELLARVRRHVTRELSVPPALVPAALGEESQLYGVVEGALALLEGGAEERRR